MAPNALSEHVRMHKQQISDRWESAVRAELRPLDPLDRSTVIDHLPEFLDGLAFWIDGDWEAASPRFEVLSTGHALQRLSFGIDLQTLTREYALLRTAILRECMSVLSNSETREALIRLHDGMDVAVNEAVRRYTDQRDKVRDRFIGVLAHDLRNPLNAIHMATARILAEAAGNDRLHRAGTTIVRSTMRMTRMIDDVIEFARSYLGGGIPIMLSKGDLGDLCRETVEELLSAHPDRDIRFDASGDLSGLWDRDRVIQALSNLVGNAIQHGSDPILVSAHEVPDRTMLITSVSNRGRAIPPAEIAKLFDAFSETKSRTGLGLGLFIVKQIVVGHGAWIEVESDDAATTFTIRWPRTPLEDVSDRV